MRKRNGILVVALAAVIFAFAPFHQAGTALAQAGAPVGVVTAYVPGQSITVVDQNGTEHEYQIGPSLKILPPSRDNFLGVGSFVTVIAPASLDNGKQTAVGIVIHPEIPSGWNVTPGSATLLPTRTMIGTQTAIQTGTPTTSETAAASETPWATATETPTAIGTFTDTPTPAPNPSGKITVNANSLLDWLSGLVRELLGSQ